MESFPFPASYVASIGHLANQELRLNWRKLASAKPPMWPGSLYLFDRSTAAEETRRFAGFRETHQRNDHYFIGNNIAGIVFALDREGRVVIFDEIEASDPDLGIVLASNFEALLGSVASDDE
jgi:hypothetical protein